MGGRLKNHTLKGGTSPYSLCIGFPPPPPELLHKTALKGLLKCRLHEPRLTCNPSSYINPGYKKKYVHKDPGWLLSKAYSPDPGWLLSEAYSPDPGWLLSKAYSPDPGWLPCEADSFNVCVLLVFILIFRRILSDCLKMFICFNKK